MSFWTQSIKEKNPAWYCLYMSSVPPVFTRAFILFIFNMFTIDCYHYIIILLLYIFMRSTLNGHVYTKCKLILSFWQVWQVMPHELYVNRAITCCYNGRQRAGLLLKKQPVIPTLERRDSFSTKVHWEFFLHLSDACLPAVQDCKNLFA